MCRNLGKRPDIVIPATAQRRGGDVAAATTAWARIEFDLAKAQKVLDDLLEAKVSKKDGGRYAGEETDQGAAAPLRSANALALRVSGRPGGNLTNGPGALLKRRV